MKNSPKLTFIDGEFTPVDAREILKNLFRTKVQFHEIKNFSSKERLGKEDPYSVKRIFELNRSLENILEIISEAKANGETLIMRADIFIQKSNAESVDFLLQGENSF